MSGDLLRIVDSIHRDKNIDKEIVFDGIESALLTAAKKHYGEESVVTVAIDRVSGEFSATLNGEPIDAETLGRIAAQSAKQNLIQKIREAERDSLFDEFGKLEGTIITGAVQRNEGGAAIVNLGKMEAFLPRSEQMPGETFHSGERVRAIVSEVRKSGQRVKVRLSRAHPDFVRRLFEQEIPEIAEHIIEIRAIAREAGHRTKVAVSSIDSRVDCVGACVGVRGARIKNILDELGGERIDIIRYNESLQVMIPNALAPAQIEEVQIYPRIGRAVVLVAEDQLSLAIGKRGQNVRLASKLVGIDIEIMTFDELTEEIDRAESSFSTLPGADEEVVDALIEEGFLSFDDLSVMEPEKIVEVTGLDTQAAEELVEFAETAAEAAPEESGSRSSVLSGSVDGDAAADLASKPAAPESMVAKPKAPTVDDVFGPPAEEAEEPKLTAQQLFAESAGEEPAAEVESAPPTPPSSIEQDDRAEES